MQYGKCWCGRRDFAGSVRRQGYTNKVRGLRSRAMQQDPCPASVGQELPIGHLALTN